jgi:hypothetical protein
MNGFIPLPPADNLDSSFEILAPSYLVCALTLESLELAATTILRMHHLAMRHGIQISAANRSDVITNAITNTRQQSIMLS